MCGIAGFAGTGDAETVRRMCERIAHRGPDDAGIFTDASACLGNRRLSIVDLAGGHQPLSNEERTCWITFNGEIYNFPALRDELQQLGHRFGTLCDTEAIVHAFESFGSDCVQHLNGMFAFALWDARAQRLLLARDRLGIKPLYYARLDDGTLVFASELKAILAFPGVSRMLDLRALDEYLRLQYVPAPRTIFAAVRKLPAGHTLSWQNGEIELSRYWQPRFQVEADLTEAEWLARLEARLGEAVRMQLMSDVPLGAFLSGGLDSTAVVLAMSRLMDRPVQTYTIGFADQRYDESAHAQAVAAHLGTKHQQIVVPPGIDEELFASLIAQLDEPLADPSFIPTYHLSKLARHDVTVVLTGDGGDETFAGYAKYQRALAWDRRWGALGRAARPLRRPLRAAAAVLPRGRRTAQLLALDRTARFAEIAYGYFSFRADELYTPEMQRGACRALGAGLWSEVEQACAGEDQLSCMQHADMLTYLPEDILMKVDKMSMAVSLEARVPLLDHVLQEMVMAMPPGLKLRAAEPKYLLKRLLRGKVPAAVLDRPKLGFAPTLSYWLGGEWARRAEREVCSGYGVRSGLFRRSGVAALSARRDLLRLWNLWVFEKWSQAYLAA